MAFGLGKLAVLESKLDIYEDLSKEMLDKLERAVGTISENSNKVAIILERHENRLDESDKNDKLIIKMLDEVKVSNTKEHEAVIERMEKVENRVSELYKFRWMVVGIAIAAMTALQVPTIVSNVLTPPTAEVSIEGR